ncbi:MULTISPECIES: TIGR04086 family membrane protein [Paenibacillus]|uniref:TIGR04086 family membrane protein n=1 Tax=Paenibacillus TaxID=44249 RepID=UPI00037F4DA9|nr:TIGR04086 family membrane protein [Paenibacillus massiliensis]
METIRRWSSARMSHPLLTGVLHAFIWMLIGSLILSTLLWLTHLKEQDLSLYTYLVHGISLFAGGFMSGKRSGQKGWYQGGLTALLYGVIVLLVGFLALDAAVGLQDMLHMAVAFCIGAVGGMIGVNMSHSQS